MRTVAKLRNRVVPLFRTIITESCSLLLQVMCGFLVSAHPEWNPRVWSNRELKRIAGYFRGSVVNVSASEDSDKNGKRYQYYFSKASSYTITNYGSGEEGGGGIPGEKILDLSKRYSGQLGKFEVVFNHTVIEHIHSPLLAIDTLCELADDIVITIVPFIQMFHGRSGSYTDYWRYTPKSLIEEFDKRGFSTVYISWNEHHPLMNVYIFHVAARHPEKYTDLFCAVRLPEVNVYGPGTAFNNLLWGNIEKSWWYKIGHYMGCRMIPYNSEY